MKTKGNDTETEKKEEEKIVLPDNPAELPPDGYTVGEWSDLSETERAGIIDSIENPEVSEITDGGEEGEDDKEVLEEIVKEGEETEEQKAERLAKEKKDGENAAAAAAVAEKQKTPAPVVSQQEDNAISDEDLIAYRPAVVAEDLKDYKEEIPEDLKQKRADLKHKFDEGDIDRDEYDDGRDAINREIFEHNQTRREETRSDVIWKKEQQYFLSNRVEYLKLKDDSAEVKANKDILYTALSSTVAQLSNDPKNGHLSGMQLMIKADRHIAKIKEALGFKKAETPVAPGKTDKGKKPAAEIPVVKTLTGIPQAGINATLDDSFSQLDKLTGEAYETALERLDPKVREAYLNRA